MRLIHCILVYVANGQCSLHSAARSSDLECLQTLKHLEELNEHGSNALHSALQGEDQNQKLLDTVSFLLERGLSVELVNQNGYLPAHALYRNAHLSEDKKVEILKVLKDYGPVPNSLPWAPVFGTFGVLPPPKMSAKLQAAATYFSLFPDERTVKCQQCPTCVDNRASSDTVRLEKALEMSDEKIKALETRNIEISERERELSRRNALHQQDADEKQRMSEAIIKTSKSEITELTTKLRDATRTIGEKSERINQQKESIDELIKQVDDLNQQLRVQNGMFSFFYRYLLFSRA